MSTSTNTIARARTLPELLRQCGPIALFLDFDGVIADIAPTPDSVEVPGSTIARLQSLNSALDGALAVVSGREVDSLDRMLAPLTLAVAGDHGNARRRNDGETVLVNEAAVLAAAALHDDVTERFHDDPRIVVERKPSAVAVHYRMAPERAQECIDVVESVVRATPELSLIQGKMVVEARASGVDKGEAVRGFMGETPFEGRTPLFVGDDVTDEDGFSAVQAMGGAGIKVGDGDTVALFRVGSTRDVVQVLDAVIRSQGWRN
jgi:trehalose 6-phosphate phosphatase